MERTSQNKDHVEPKNCNGDVIYFVLKSLIILPYQYRFLHENCIVTDNSKPYDIFNKIVKYKSNIQQSQNLKAKAVRKLQNYKCAIKIEIVSGLWCVRLRET